MIPTFQISITDKCNANCFFCISKQTPKIDHSFIDWTNFEKACDFAKNYGCKVGKITAKGDPLWRAGQALLASDIMSTYFDLIELQTNGILLKDIDKKDFNNIDLISISCVHYKYYWNELIYGNKYYNLERNIRLFYSEKIIRLSCTLLKGFIDSVDKIKEFINYFKEYPNLQFSFIELSNICGDKNIDNFMVKDLFDERWPVVNKKKIYYNKCLPENDKIRHLVYFPDGKIRTRWDNLDSVIWE